MKAKILLTTSLGIGCITISLWAPPSSAQETSQTTKTGDQAANQIHDQQAGLPDSDIQANFWMDQKLRLSKEILTGLANADFELIGKNAEVIRGLNRVEKFVRRGPEGYRDQLKLFNMANNALVRASEEENLEGVTLAFNQLTISCVNCHKHLRENE
jgi:hypothetical protein